mgnify:FL=1
MVMIKIKKLSYVITALLACVAVFLSILSVMQHPLIGDDRHFIWDLSEHGSMIAFIIDYYNTWGGNIFHTMIWAYFSSSSINLLLYKALLVPIFVLMAVLAYYLSTNRFPSLARQSYQDFIVYASILWLAIPEIGQTIAWATGSVYLCMTFCSLIFLSLINHGRQKILLGIKLNYGLISRIFILVFAFLIGTSSVQMFSSLMFVILYWLWDLKKEELLREIPAVFYLSLLCLLLGFLVLVIAPGNYERLATYEDQALTSIFLKYFMYLAGAYFSGGSGNLGSSLILGSVVIMLSGSIKKIKDIKRESLVWFGASLISLAPMILAVNFTSPRTTFMAAIFFLIGIKSMSQSHNEFGGSAFTANSIPILCCLLVIVDSFVGWSSNLSLTKEVENRMSIIETSIQENKKDIIVPYFATIPSRQTYMMKPNHDQEYLDIMAKHFKVNSIKQDSSMSAPKPNTLNSLKALREVL